MDQGDGVPDGVPLRGGPPAADTPGGRGILLANQLTDSLLISDTRNGVTASVTVCLPAATGAASDQAEVGRSPADLTEPA
jgi:anti-sigma regulatory factor (Ser/Thr protein kinase)